MRIACMVCRSPAVALICALLIAAALAQGAAAQVTQGRKEQRLALVIGNSAYKASPLPNPVNDARAMADALKATGFTVIRKENASLKDMTLALREFGDRLKKGGVGLFYYAGHGMAVKGRNFLIPVDAEIQREDEVSFNALDAGAVLDKMESAGNRLNLVILDACRNNPFARSFRSASQGLAQMDAPVGTLVSFATAPGQVASDGEGKNGLFTQHLLENIKRPGLKIEDLFKAVRVSVRRDSQGKQVPWEASSLEGDFYFIAAPAAAPPTPAPAAAGTAAAGAPAARGSVPAVVFPAGAPVLHPGDNWTYRHTDLKKNTTREVTNHIEEVLPDRLRFRGNNYVTDLGQSVLFDRSKTNDKVVETRFEPAMPLLLFPQRVGESKSGTIAGTRNDGSTFEQRYEMKVLRKEKVTVPAGTFEAFYSERELALRNQPLGAAKSGLQSRLRLWYAPEVKRFVKLESEGFDSSGKAVPLYRRELLSFQLNP